MTKIQLLKFIKYPYFLYLIGLVIILKTSSVASKLLVNAGMIQWNRASVLADDPDLFLIEPGIIDTRFFEKSLTFNQENIRAHHWLGFANIKSGFVEEAIIQWQLADLTGNYFTIWGDLFRKANNDRAALPWYEKALMLDVNWSDAWYHIGGVLFRQQDIELSIDAYRNAINKNKFQQVGISDAYTRLALIYQSSEAYKNMPEALKKLDLALSQNHFTSDKLHAEAYYKRGEIYRWQNRNAQEYIVEYENALSVAPYHRWARLRLGISLYQVYNDLELSEEQIKLALENWPQDRSRKWPYHYLGNLYHDAGLFEQATLAYQEALIFDPDDQNIQELLRDLSED